MKLIEDYESAKKEIAEQKRKKLGVANVLDEAVEQRGTSKKLTKKEVQEFESSKEKRKSLQAILIQEAERKKLISDIESLDKDSSASERTSFSKKDKSALFKEMASGSSNAVKKADSEPHLIGVEDNASDLPVEAPNAIDKKVSSIREGDAIPKTIDAVKESDNKPLDEGTPKKEEKAVFNNSDDDATVSPRLLNFSEIVDETDIKKEPDYLLDIGMAEVEGESLEFPIIESKKDIDSIVISDDGERHALFVNDEKVSMSNRWFHCLLSYVEEIEEDSELDIKLQFNEQGGIADVDMPDIKVSVRSYAVVIIGDEKPVRRLVIFKS